MARQENGSSLAHMALVLEDIEGLQFIDSAGHARHESRSEHAHFVIPKWRPLMT